MEENELVSDFVDRCGSRGQNPVDVLKVLNSQGWNEDEYVTIPPFAVMPEDETE